MEDLYSSYKPFLLKTRCTQVALLYCIFWLQGQEIRLTLNRFFSQHGCKVWRKGLLVVRSLIVLCTFLCIGTGNRSHIFGYESLSNTYPLHCLLFLSPGHSSTLLRLRLFMGIDFILAGSNRSLVELLDHPSYIYLVMRVYTLHFQYIAYCFCLQGIQVHY